MLTRCPDCGTTFRVTSEQLKARAGTVRCGKCQTIFNALDTLVDAPSPTETDIRTTALPATEPPSPTAATPPPETEIASIDTEEVDILLESDDISTDPETPEEPETPPPLPDTPPLPSLQAPAAASVRDSALAAGLVAARETTEVPGYNKWAEGAFATSARIATPPVRTLWPLVLASLLLTIALAGQAAYRFRADLAAASPGLRPLLETFCDAAGCDIPLPRNSELVSIESSDLQIDAARGGLLVLSATLKNRAAFAQAWPALELTLTDTQDNALLRRILTAPDYLPPKHDPTVFPPNGEVGLRLWLEASEIAAAGYRLYVFYP